ncbi:hypothetical protein [Pedobacter jeongneungensis]|uniref:hypothetical protein n=1 Tax=Pedobacter jeongneungensis TaxID=947309 RepID=UPI000469DFC2|nr:hypothetical protein [Pedobacter jeongneungensis]
MKTKLKMSGLIIVFAVLIGCTKEKNQGRQNDPLVTDVKPDLINTYSGPAANNRNPYDSIGIEHNKLLDSLRNYVAVNNDTTHAGAVKYLQQYFLKHKGIRVYPVMEKETGIAIIQDYHKFMQQPGFSVEAQKYILEMMTVLDGIRDMEHFEAYRDKLISIENSVLISRLDIKEAKYILATASVLRHSGYYWMKVFSSGMKPKRGILGILRKIAGVITAIAADATVVGWHLVKNSPYDVLIEETVTWSEVCGYYTGWYPDGL